MDFSNVIDKIMPEVRNGGNEPFIIYHDKDGGWHGDFTRNQYGDTFDWVEDVKEQDPLALVFKGSDFANGSFPYVYDAVLAARIREEYSLVKNTGMDNDELHTLAHFFADNVSEFSQNTTDYLASLERPLTVLAKICTFIPEIDGADNDDNPEDLIEEIEVAIMEMQSDNERDITNGNTVQRDIEGYTSRTSVTLAGETVVLGGNPKAAEPYLVCNIRRSNLLGVEEHYNGVVTVDYLEALREFTNRIDELTKSLETEREQRGLPFVSLTVSNCVPNGFNMDLTGRLIIIDPKSLAPEYRSADHQLQICTGGFGASPDSRGSAVYCKDLYSGKESRFERYDVLGVADLERLPEWAKKKLALIETLKDPGVFEYSGYHFKPVRQFEKGEIDKQLAGDSRPWKKDAQFAMRNMSSDFDLNIRNQNSKGKADYSNEKFYAASGGSEADVFMCIENGKLYVPGANELFRYNEPPQKEKKPSLLGKLDDNKQKVERGKAERTDKPVTKKHGDLEVD